jgi:hypothetical protein
MNISLSWFVSRNRLLLSSINKATQRPSRYKLMSGVIETEDWVFTRSPGVGNVPTMRPLRRLWHPQASLSLAPERFFVQKNILTIPSISDTQWLRVRPPTRDLGDAFVEALSTWVSHHPLLPIHITKEKNHHHRHVNCRRIARAAHLPRSCPNIQDLTLTMWLTPQQQAHWSGRERSESVNQPPW